MHKYLTLEHVIEQLMSSARELTKGTFNVITILNNHHLAVVLCILSLESYAITRCLLIRNYKHIMN